MFIIIIIVITIIIIAYVAAVCVVAFISYSGWTVRVLIGLSEDIFLIVEHFTFVVL